MGFWQDFLLFWRQKGHISFHKTISLSEFKSRNVFVILCDEDYTYLIEHRDIAIALIDTKLEGRHIDEP